MSEFGLPAMGKSKMLKRLAKRYGVKVKNLKLKRSDLRGLLVHEELHRQTHQMWPTPRTWDIAADYMINPGLYRTRTPLWMHEVN